MTYVLLVELGCGLRPWGSPRRAQGHKKGFLLWSFRFLGFKGGSGGLHQGVLIGRVTGANPIKGLGTSQGVDPSLPVARAGMGVGDAGVAADAGGHLGLGKRSHHKRTGVQDTAWGHPASQIPRAFIFLSHLCFELGVFVHWLVCLR